MADSVAVMQGGRIVMHDAPANVYSTPTSLEVARFVGDVVELPVSANGETALGPLPEDSNVPPGGGIAVLRPEQLVLTPALAAPMGSAHAVVATVAEVEYFGHDTLVALDLPGASGGRVLARCARPPEPGSRVRIDIEGPVSCYATDSSGV